MDRYDALCAIGALFLAVGLGLISLPLALCVIGALLLAVGLVGAYGKGRAK